MTFGEFCGEAFKLALKVILNQAKNAPNSGRGQISRLDSYVRQHPELTEEQLEKIEQKKEQIRQNIDNSYGVQEFAKAQLERLNNKQQGEEPSEAEDSEQFEEWDSEQEE